MKKLICIILYMLCENLLAEPNNFVVNKSLIESGSAVKIKGQSFPLYKGSLKVQDNFLEIIKNTDINFKFNNNVTVVSIVPSIDTKVCERQTHILADAKIPLDIDRVTISRDQSTAQQRFAKAAKITNIDFYSDHKDGSFGRKTGLLISGKDLLTRGVMVLDKRGYIRYLQLVSELSQLPDMDKAFKVAATIANSANAR